MRAITIIPGDGIGPEVIDAAVRCIKAAGVKIRWEFTYLGGTAKKMYGTELPEASLELIKKNKVALKGPLTTPIAEGYKSVTVRIRKALDLFANVRPAKLIPGVKSRYEKVDLVVIRENLEDLYAGIEYEKGKFKGLPKDAAVALKVITAHNSGRIAKFAFEYAAAHRRKKVTCAHKANVLKETDGLFLKTARQVAARFPAVQFEDRIVDNMAMQLVLKPEDYDVLLCPNLYGDILSDLCAGLIGGLGLAPSANIGERYALFEPVHGSAPKYAGKNKVNPTATILAGVMMLRHLGETRAASKIEAAVHAVIKEGKKVTYDLAKRRSVGTQQMTEAIIERI